MKGGFTTKFLFLIHINTKESYISDKFHQVSILLEKRVGKLANQAMYLWRYLIMINAIAIFMYV